MARRGRPPKNKISLPKVELDLKQETKQSLFAVLFFALAVLTVLSLVNVSGSLGQVLVRFFRLAFGWGAFLLPVFFILISISILRDLKKQKEENEAKSSTHAYVGVGVLSLVIICCLQLIASRDAAVQMILAQEGQGGGYVGAAIALGLLKTIGPYAGFVLLALGVIAGILITFNIPINDLFSWFKGEDEDEEELPAKPAKEPGGLKINDPLASGFRVEQVSKSNPVAAGLSKNKPLPRFIGKSKPEGADLSPGKPADRQPEKSWKFPPLDLFEQSNTSVDSGNIEANVANIQKTLADFDIEVEMGEVNIGPTVTQYTLRPAEGVRLSAIVALQNDLKLALAASSIRIEAPIPGRSLVGVEVPNQTAAVVRLRELYEMEDFQNQSSPLAFVLGRDVAGKGVVEDLAKMPHLLIAGSTGSGKSVCMNVLLTSFLVRNTPQQVKFIIIDPKRVEMSLYNDIPHLVTPVITDHQKAVNALRWTVAEMDRRYHLLSEARKRNIGEYNEISPNPLSYLVVIVDELADLMAVARNDVEAAIVRLAQMARAVGIHLVLATQRPSVDILTGLIKANVTSRIAFAVASQVDSRTILDQAGAEKLLGRGDMLYVTAEMSQPKRIQGGLISEKEVKKVTDFLRKEGDPTYDESVTQKVKVASGEYGSSGGDADDEPLLEEAKGMITEAGKASASFLQRRLKIGYARAARILDILEDQGVVGPAEGSKPREVYGYEGTPEPDSLQADGEYPNENQPNTF